MANYVIVLSKKSEKQLDKLSDSIAVPILNAIEKLGENPRPIGSIKLKSVESYRIRVGDYRIIYNIFNNELIIEIIALGHRREIYK